MISREEIASIGRFVKTHGINGELVLSLDNADWGEDVGTLFCLVLEMDGIFVPFFMQNVRGKGADSVLVKIEDVDDEKAAALLAGHEVFALGKDLDEKGFLAESGDEVGDEMVYAEDLLEFAAVTDSGVCLGNIVDVNDMTDNVLLEVEDKAGRSIYIPFVDEYIVDINEHERVVTFTLPTGFLEMQ